MKTYTTENGTYDFYVDFTVDDDKTVSDYAYFQHTTEITEQIIGDDWAYCSATALAQCMAIYYNDFSIKPTDYMDDFNNSNDFNWGNDPECEEELGDLYGAAYSDDSHNTEDPVSSDYSSEDKDSYWTSIKDLKETKEYIAAIKESLEAGKPVVICVLRYDSNGGAVTHYVTVVGVRSGVSLEDAEYTDFVIFDPGTATNQNITTLDNTYSGYTYYPFNYRIISPYLIDENGDYVLDENGEKTTDPYYLDPVYDSDGNMLPAAEGKLAKEIIRSVNGSNVEESKKESLINQMFRIFSGKDISLGKYIFPDGTDFAEIKALTGAEVTVTNETTGVSVIVEQYPETGETYDVALDLNYPDQLTTIYSGTIIRIMQNGRQIAKQSCTYSWHWSLYQFKSWDIVDCDDENGAIVINYSSRNTGDFTATGAVCPQLKNFKSTESRYSVRN